MAVATRVINDLKNSGQESVDALVKTIHEYEGVEKKLNLVIDKEKKSLEKREKKLSEKQKHLKELKTFVEAESGRQDETIMNICNNIKERNKTIEDLNYEIVLL